MKVRVLISVLLALVVGVGAGYAVAATQDDDEAAPAGPRTAEVSPVPASPTVPVEELNPDPTDPTLEPGIPLVPETLVVPGDADTPTYSLTLPTPDGWGRRDGDAKWTYTPDGTSEYPYGLRVQVIADRDVTVSEAVRSRTAALESAQAQGNLSDLELTLDPAGNGFESHYVDNGYRTVSLEEFYVGDDGSTAFATVAAYGREQDLEGLVDLLALVTKDLRTEEKPPQPG